MSKIQTIVGSDLTKALHKATRSLCKEVAKQEPHSALSSPKKQAEQLELQIEEAFEKLTIEYEKASKVLLETVHLLAMTHAAQPDIDYEAIVEELQNAGKKVDAGTLRAFAKQVCAQDHVDAGKLCSISEATTNALYKAGVYLLDEKRFSDALPAFSLICSLQPNVYRHWVGYGHAAFHHHQYDTAILAYYMAMSLRPMSPWPFIWAANACERKNELELARKFLERAKELQKEVAIQGPGQKMGLLVQELTQRINTLTLKTKK